MIKRWSAVLTIKDKSPLSGGSGDFIVFSLITQSHEVRIVQWNYNIYA